ncbi:autophagy 18 B-like protein isoform X2 [Wolffia australiana]
MASSSSSASPILCASFNQDNSCFAIGTREGFRIFNAETGRLCFERSIGAFSIVEMLYSSSFLAIVGAGEQPSLSPRRLSLFNTTTGATLKELNFLTSILAIRLNKKRLIVVLLEKTYVYDLSSLAILDTIDTVPNPKGLCAFAPNSGGCYLALPASKNKGSVLVFNTMELLSFCQIDAHQNPLAAVAFSLSGTYMATASDQGTVIRVHLVSQATKSYDFRRGTYPSVIYSLCFGPSIELPDVLVVTSSSGSVHIFSLETMLTQRKPAGFLDALESSHHHVVHKAAPQGIRSYVAVHRVDKAGGAAPGSSSSLSGGHFREIFINISPGKGVSWSLERESNLLM